MSCVSDNLRIRPFALNCLLWVTLLWLGQLSAFADNSVSLSWYPSSDPTVTGYKVYYGGASEVYTNSFSVGSATNATVSGLSGGATYYFSATSVTASGEQSIFSNEATYAVPADTNAPSGGTTGLPPTLDPIANLNIYQNAGPQTINLTGISAGSSGNPTVNVSAVSGDNGTIISTPTVNYTSSIGTGTLTFTPTGTAGSATVTVTVNNGGATNNLVSQAFTVTVLPIPVTSQTPTLNALTNLTIYENSGLQMVALTGIGAGTGGNPTVTISATSSATAVIPTPTVNYSSSSTTGTLTFAPSTNALGTATVTVIVNNGNSSNNLVSQAFTVTVVPAPVVAPTLNAITNLTIYENSGQQTVALTGISAGSGANPTVTIAAASSATSIIPTPTVNYTSSSTTGTLTFAPAANALGTATVTVTVNNGGASNNLISQAFTVTVIPAVPPTLSAIANLTIYENSGLQTVALTGISAGAGGNPTVTISVASSATSIIPTPTVNYTSSSTAGTLTFAPAANALGTATVTVTVNNGGTTSNLVSRAFTVTVIPAAPPTLNAIANLTIYENSGLQTVALTGISAGAGGNPTVTISAASSATSIIPQPTVNYGSSSTTGTLTFTPAANALGTATVTVTVNNGGTTSNLVSRAFTVTVIPAVPPTLNAITNLTIYENSGLQTVALTGISAGAGGNPTVTISAASSATALIPTPTVNYTSSSTVGTLTFAPAANALGTATVTVTVNNGATSNNLISQAFIVTVVPAPVVIQPPTLNPITNLTVNESSGRQTVTLAGISAGAGGNSTVTISAASSNPAVIPTPTISYTASSSTGTLTFAPVTNVLGSSILTVTLNNGAPSNNIITRTFTITVVVPPGGNEPPTLNTITNVTIIQGPVKDITLTGITSGSSTEKQTLKISATSSNTKIVPTPTISHASGATTATLALKSTAIGLGVATITVTVNDSGKSNNIVKQNFTVTVVPNQPPTLNPIANVTVEKDATTQTITLTGISSTVPEVNQVLTITATSSNTKLIAKPTIQYTSPASTGLLSFKPTAKATGKSTITVTVNNGGPKNNLVHQTFVVTVSTNAAVLISAESTNVMATLESAVRSGGHFSFQVTGVSGGKYVVQATSDLTHWTPLQTNTAPFTFTESTTNTTSQRFYRASYLP